MKNQLYFADNLEVLKRLYAEYPKGLIDLIYIDPPFNSKRDYSVLFETIDMTDTKAQKEAFADTWSNVSYIDTLNELHSINPDIYTYLNCLNGITIAKSTVSYLTTMAIRIYYMHKLLKDTGSFYLHCDPTMSHYLKIVCDLIFGNKNFRNEIIWCYTAPTNTKENFPKKHDIIFRYTKSDKWIFNYEDISIPYSEETVARTERGSGDKGLYGNKNPEGKHANRLKPEGKIPEDWWTIPRLQGNAIEKLGYPTQKPEALLERIIKVSSKKSDLIADFFCGCGTTVAMAQKLNRKWIGVDISHLAVNLIMQRIKKQHTNNKKILENIEIHGFPKDIDSARELANNVKEGRFQFEQWIVEVMLNGVLNERKNQLGYDGYFTLDVQGKKEYGLIEVKSGTATVQNVNHFITQVNDKKAGFGIFVCFKEQITKNMLETAKKQGRYKDFAYDRIQIVSVEDLLDDRLPHLPESTKTTFKSAGAETTEEDTQTKLEME